MEVGREGRSEYEQCATRLMHCFAHCRIAADAGVDAAEVHLANKKNCINFIKFEMSSNCRALPAKCIHIQTNIFIYACGCVCVAGLVCVCVDLHHQWHRRVEHGWKPSSSSSLPLPAASAWLCSGSASGSAVGRVQFAAILKIVHQNPQSNLLRCFMTVLRAADFTPLKTTAQPTHNTLAHTIYTHTHTQHTFYMQKLHKFLP